MDGDIMSMLVFEKIKSSNDNFQEQVEFFNRVRNYWAPTHLHDPNTYTIEQTTQFIIDCEREGIRSYQIVRDSALTNTPIIGYVRWSLQLPWFVLSEPGMIMVGVDLSPEFVGRGYGTRIYNQILSTYPYTFILEVLETNTKAIRLYEKLGFYRLHEYYIQTKQFVRSFVYEYRH